MRKVWFLAMLLSMGTTVFGQALNNGLNPQQTSQTPLSLRVSDGDLSSVLGTAQFQAKTLLLQPNTTTYIFLDMTQTPPALVQNTTGFPVANVYTIAIVVTNSTKIVTVTDKRPPFNKTQFGSVGKYYQTIEQGSVAQPQEPTLNFPAYVSCVDNAGNTSTDCTPNIMVGAGGSHAAGLAPDPGAVVHHLPLCDTGDYNASCQGAAGTTTQNPLTPSSLSNTASPFQIGTSATALDMAFTGPNPWVDVRGWGVRAVANTYTNGLTGNISAGSSTLSISASSGLKNGDGITVFNAGIPNTIGTPPVPTVVPSVPVDLTGTGHVVNAPAGSNSNTYSVVWFDNAGGYTAHSTTAVTSTAGTLGAGNQSLTGLVVTPSAATISGGTLTLTGVFNTSLYLAGVPVTLSGFTATGTINGTYPLVTANGTTLTLLTAASGTVSVIGTVTSPGCARTNNIMTCVTAARSPEIFSVNEALIIAGTSNDQNFGNMFLNILSLPTNNTFTAITSIDTRSSSSQSSYATGGKVYYFNANHISCGTPPANATRAVVYGRTSGTRTPIGVCGPVVSANSTDSTYMTLDDYGSPMMDSISLPPWVPATEPSAAGNDNLTTTISSGGGTTTLTLAAAAGTNACGTGTCTGTGVRFDNAPNILAAAIQANSTGGPLYFPVTTSGNYYLTNSYMDLSGYTLSVEQAGAIWLGDTVKTALSIKWYGYPNGAACVTPQFGVGCFTALYTGTANPGILGVGGTWKQLTVLGNGNQANPFFFTGALPTATFEDMNITSGGNSSDYMGIPITFFGPATGGQSGVRMKNILLFGGPAQTLGASTTPLLMSKNFGEIHIEGLINNARGLYFGVGLSGLTAQVDVGYEFQGAITPLVTAYGSGPGSIIIRNPIIDTSYVPTAWCAGAAFCPALTVDGPYGGIIADGPFPYVNVITGAIATSFTPGANTTAVFPVSSNFDGTNSNAPLQVDNIDRSIGPTYKIFSDTVQPPAPTCTVASAGPPYTVATTGYWSYAPVYPGGGFGRFSSMTTTPCASNGTSQQTTLSYTAIQGAISYVYAYANSYSVNGGGAQAANAASSCAIPSAVGQSTTTQIVTGSCGPGLLLSGDGPASMGDGKVVARNFVMGASTQPSGIVGALNTYFDNSTFRPSFNPNNAGWLKYVGIGTAAVGGHCPQFAANGIDLVDSGSSGCGGGSNPMTTLGDSIYGGASGTPTRLAGPVGPNGVPQVWTSVPSGGAATAVNWSAAGVTPRAVTGTTDTILSTDCTNNAVYTGSSSVAVSLPTPTTLGISQCTFRIGNYTTGTATTVTVTPVTLTIGQPNNTATTLVIQKDQWCTLTVDGTNWDANCPTLQQTYFYAANYSGLSVDVQVNACLADALSVGGTCDSRGVTGNVAAVITVGNSSYNPVRLIFPDSGTWTCTGTGGSNPCILQYVGSSIVGPLKIGGAPPFTIAAGGSSNLSYVYTTNCSSTVGNGRYLHIEGVQFKNSGAVTANNVTARFCGTDDNATVDNVFVYDTKDATALSIDAMNAASTFHNLEVNCNYTAGCTPLVISSSSGSVAKMQAMKIDGLGGGHPGTGLPIIKISDSNATPSTQIEIRNCYLETSNSDTTTTLVQIDGERAVDIDCAFHPVVASDTAAGLSISNTWNTAVKANLHFVPGSSAWASYPMTGIINNNTSSCNSTPCNIQTDALGNLVNWSTEKLQTVAPTTASAGLNLPHGTAPTSPVNGDCWTTTAGLYCRINGSTVGPYTGSGGLPSAAINTVAVGPTDVPGGGSATMTAVASPTPLYFVDPRAWIYNFDDFLNVPGTGISGWTAGGTGGTASWIANQSGTAYGVFACTTLAVASDTCYATQNANSTGFNGSFNGFTAGDIIYRVKLTQTTNTNFFAGLIDINTLHGEQSPNVIGIGYNVGKSDTQWMCVLGSGSTYTRTAITGTVNTSWHDLRIRFTSAGHISCSVDQGAETAISTNFPSSTNMTPHVSIDNNATGNIVAVQVDYFLMAIAASR